MPPNVTVPVEQGFRCPLLNGCMVQRVYVMDQLNLRTRVRWTGVDNRRTVFTCVHCRQGIHTAPEVVHHMLNKLTR